MGSGRWSATTFKARGVARARSGADTFAYSARAIATGKLRPHQTLDPHGLRMRESRDSNEHPNSNAIIISLDVTGSMGAVVRAIHADLPRLHELILGHNYITDPQIMFAAVGDAIADAVPLQVGQFESDNRMDEHLENMILEGGGGGTKRESYELMLYVAARHTDIDCWKKRQRKGYLFIIGDEMAYPQVNRQIVQKTLGEHMQESSLPEVIEEAKQRYHVYFVIPGGASHGDDQEVIGFWNQHLGAQNVIRLQAPEDTSECIGLTIGIKERGMNLNDVTAELARTSTPPATIERLRQSLAPLFGSTGVEDRARRL